MKKILRLRKLRPADAKYFLKWWTDKELIALTSGRPVEPADRLLGYFQRLLGERHNYLITVNGKVIGHVMIVRRGKNSFGFPIVIGEPKYRGRGYGSRAIRKILSIGFLKLGYKEARLEVRPENAGAIKVYASLGFRPIGTKTYNNPYQPKVQVMAMSRAAFVASPTFA